MTKKCVTIIFFQVKMLHLYDFIASKSNITNWTPVDPFYKYQCFTCREHKTSPTQDL